MVILGLPDSRYTILSLVLPELLSDAGFFPELLPDSFPVLLSFIALFPELFPELLSISSSFTELIGESAEINDEPDGS